MIDKYEYKGWLNSHIIKGEIIDKEICDCMKRVKDFRFSLTKRKEGEK